ncbi:MAG: hypothetical protein D3M94_06310 [Rhodocyclales bacterium GT-UBC]|nr:MAG: hypothetical protein D3M94_06310 [Rhodocyclales bacterium GT-UBC]
MNEMSAFPVAPETFRGESREVDPGACFDWLRQGWAMFMVNPGVWIGCSVLLLIIQMAFNVVPIFGQFAAYLLVPLFGAGMVQVCRHIAQERPAEIADLFAGFRHNAGPLIMVGLFFAGGVFGLAFIAVILVNGGVFGSGINAKVFSASINFGSVMLAGLLVAVLSIPVIMATWFAPALVFLHDMKPVAAIRASFDAGFKNWLVMIVFGTFLIVALFFAMLPLGLGLILLLPIFSGAVYASYRDIFLGT